MLCVVAMSTKRTLDTYVSCDACIATDLNKPIELLVPVSYMCYHTSTSGLSTWWSTTTLIGNTSFEVSFPLRCFQRLSFPYLATLRCGWRHNRYTRGMSIPVLSY